MSQILGTDAFRVHDEDGKGAEVLRSVVTAFAATGTHPVFIAEVDSVIRVIKVRKTGTGNAATLHVTKKADGSGTAKDISNGTVNLNADYVQHSVYELPIKDGTLKKGDLVEITLGGTETGVSVQVGWAPDMFSLDADYRTYTLPS